MRKVGLTIVSGLICFPMLWGCSSTDDNMTLGHMPGPEVSIEKIWIDDVEYAPTDTITIEKASKVFIDYTITSEADLLMVNHYYVYGSSGSLLVSHPREELDSNGALRKFTGRLECDGFLPARCGFRVFAANGYGGTDSQGFFLKLPTEGLGDIPNTTPLFQHNGRNLGPSQDKNAPPLGKSFENGKKNGRYTFKDAANDADRAGSNEFGSGYKDGKLVIYSPNRHDALFPDSKIVFKSGVTNDDMTETKFKRLDLFTASMWNACTSNERLEYLADSFIPTTTETEVYPDAVGYYFFHSKSPLNEWFGIIYLKNMGTPDTYAQYDLRIYKYW